MEYFTSFLFFFLFLSFLLEYSLGVEISGVPGLSLKNIALFIMFIVAIFRIASEKKPSFPDRKLLVTVLVFITWSLLSLLMAFIGGRFPKADLISEIMLWKSTADPYLLLIITAMVLRNSVTSRHVIFQLFVVLLIFNLLTIAGAFNILRVSRIEMLAHGRITGAIAEPNEFAGYVCLFIPLNISILMNSKTMRAAIWYFGILLTSIFVLLLSGSRGGLVSAIFGVLFLMAIGAGSFTKFCKRMVFSVPVFIGIILVIVLILPSETKLGLTENIFQRGSAGSFEQYSSGRLSLWRAALPIIMDNFFLGAGINPFINFLGGNSHNMYLLIFGTFGIVGLIAFLYILWRIYFNVKLYLRTSPPDDAYLYQGFLGGFMAFLISMLFVNMYSPMYFFFVFSGVMLKYGYTADRLSSSSG